MGFINIYIYYHIFISIYDIHIGVSNTLKSLFLLYCQIKFALGLKQQQN